ncbi:cupin domain-containing protein [Clostridium sp. 19966]|uniref:cupin domain-containing protein n=1 Tax=Clostridium sp. 19966 TaxID=2768166 RepID=UPI0028DFA0DF|nr:cupin domain-containing protein [Clostridium sp. 19966]MDT8717543.1 cupin domain-containing protein [Clostridium sp. 19966]
MKGKFFKNIEIAKALLLKEDVAYAPGQVVSKTLVQTNNVGITLFSFDKGEEISAHSAPGDALIYVSEGTAAVTIGDNEPEIVTEGKLIVMPANVPHAVMAAEKFKMMLIVVKG